MQTHEHTLQALLCVCVLLMIVWTTSHPENTGYILESADGVDFSSSSFVLGGNCTEANF